MEKHPRVENSEGVVGEIVSPSDKTILHEVSLSGDSLSASPISSFRESGSRQVACSGMLEVACSDLNAPCFLTAVQAFSDIVSRAADPFSLKLSALLELSARYVQCEQVLYCHLEDDACVTVHAYSSIPSIPDRFPCELPFIQKILTAAEPIEVRVEAEETEAFGKQTTRVLAWATRSASALTGALICIDPAEVSPSHARERQLFLKLFARYLGNEAKREEVRRALTYRIEFEQLLRDISRGFIHIETADIDRAIGDALRRVAEFSGVDMSYLLMFRDEYSTIEITHWWMEGNRVPNFPLANIPVSLFAWSLKQVLRREVVVLHEQQVFPPEATAEQRFMRSQNIKTSILAPLVSGSRVLGLVGFAATDQEFIVDRDAIQLLEMVGHTLVSAVELKQTNEKLNVLEAQMRHSQKLESLGVLAGGIAHDFNNLLMGILGNAGIALQDEHLSATTRDCVERVERIARHAGELTNQLLAYSGRGKFVVEAINVSDIVGKMSDLLSTVVSKKHRLIMNFAKDLPVIEVDVAQFSQVVMNLITNASEAIGDTAGDITLSTGLLAISNDSLYESYYSNDTPDGVYVYLRVADSGCGMDADTKSRIFDPFFSTKFTGRGLGLAAVLGIIRSHGGTIRVDSAPGKGTTFSVLLPCARQQEIVTTASEPIAEPQANVKSDWGSRCILVVDDEEAIRSVLYSVLTRRGATVMLAENGSRALELFAEMGDRIDACVVDMTMPDISGYEVCEQIRLQSRQMPIVLTSGYSEWEVRKHCDTLGDADFIQKPFHPNSLVARLEQHFQ